MPAASPCVEEDALATEHPVQTTPDAPLMLLVPGHDDARSRAWAAAWQRRFPDALPVDLGHWDRPHRNSWVNRINLAVHQAARPVVIVAEGLGCAVVAWWAAYEVPVAGARVGGVAAGDPAALCRLPAGNAGTRAGGVARSAAARAWLAGGV